MRQYSGGEKEESSGRRGVGQSDSCVPSARSSPRCNQLIADSLEGLVFPPLALSRSRGAANAVRVREFGQHGTVVFVVARRRLPPFLQIRRASLRG